MIILMIVAGGWGAGERRQGRHGAGQLDAEELSGVPGKAISYAPYILNTTTFNVYMFIA